QAVWTSVLMKPGEALHFESPRHLMGYLAGVARNKVYEEHRRQSTRKYNIKLEQPLYTRGGESELARELTAKDPSPSQTLQADDRLERILKGRSSFERKVVELRKNQMTFEEIGRRLGLHESAVRKVVTDLKRREERR
ncbi:MAG: RNA polymerase sigma factor, partial [Isosphaeraceae bacterium]